jgi:putative phosphoesterase
MKILIFSDIHGNLPALEKVLNKEMHHVDGYINLGDVVNYGPWSNECVERVSELKNCYHILGNHEEYFINQHCDVPNPLVLSFYNQCIKDFRYTEAIKSYKKSLNINGFKVVHTLGLKDYIFHDSDVSLTENMLIGHSHQQYIRQIDGYTLINPGSIGQNRKYINIANYVIWDWETGSFDLREMKFDLDILLNEMKAQNYPAQCIEYYKSKKTIN